MKKRKKKICFVIMGFGKKKDPETNRVIDLDVTYEQIIRPAAEAAGCNCIRADEILDSGIIDKSMYGLLYCADVVVADISTLNPNALYELGVRHALRAHSTIIMKEGKMNLPFDINHIRTVCYKHLGSSVADEEINSAIAKLKELIGVVTRKKDVDSPVYTLFPDKIKNPKISDKTIKTVLKTKLSKRARDNSVHTLTEKAKEKMEANEFEAAEEIWKKLCSKVEGDKYYIQQRALSMYKSKKPSEQSALTEALKIMGKIADQVDTETLGLLGSINKRLWEITHDGNYLNSAINYYRKGWNLHKDYYTGENYAFCMWVKSKLEGLPERRIHAEVEVKLTYEEIISILENIQDEPESEDKMWRYAALSKAYLALGKNKEAEEFEKEFRNRCVAEWQVTAFEETKNAVLRR